MVFMVNLAISNNCISILNLNIINFLYCSSILNGIESYIFDTEKIAFENFIIISQLFTFTPSVEWWFFNRRRIWKDCKGSRSFIETSIRFHFHWFINRNIDGKIDRVSWTKYFCYSPKNSLGFQICTHKYYPRASIGGSGDTGSNFTRI